MYSQKVTDGCHICDLLNMCKNIEQMNMCAFFQVELFCISLIISVSAKSFKKPFFLREREGGMKTSVKICQCIGERTMRHKNTICAFRGPQMSGNIHFRWSGM